MSGPLLAGFILGRPLIVLHNALVLSTQLHPSARRLEQADGR